MRNHFIPIQNANEGGKKLESESDDAAASLAKQRKIKIGDLSKIGNTRHRTLGDGQTRTKHCSVNEESRNTKTGQPTCFHEHEGTDSAKLTDLTSESVHPCQNYSIGLGHPRFGDKASYARIKDPDIPNDLSPQIYSGQRHRDVRFADTPHASVINRVHDDEKRSRSESPLSALGNRHITKERLKKPVSGIKSCSEVVFGRSREREGRSRERRRQSATICYNAARPTTFPLKMTTFTSRNDGITQEYMFPCENVPSAFTPNAGKASEHKKLPDDDSHSEGIPNSNKTSLLSIPANESVFTNRHVRKHNSDNMTDRKETRNMRRLRCERTSVSAPTSPTFRKSATIERFCNTTSSSNFSSVESIPTSSRNDSPDSVRSLPSTYREIQTRSPTVLYYNQPFPIISFTRASESHSPANVPEANHETYENADDVHSLADEQVPRSSRSIKTTAATREGNISMRDEKASYSWEDRTTGRRRSETVINNFSQEHRSPVSKPRRALRSETGDHEPIRPTARRAAVVSTLPDSDLTCLSDTIASMQRNQPVLSAEMKRSRWNFLNFKSKDKDRSGNLKLEEVLHRWKTKDDDLTLTSTLRELTSCKGENRWHRNGSHTTKHSSISAPFHSSTSTRERKRQDAVWELFTSERTYLIDHVLVLQQVFMEPLQQLQCDGYLLAVDVRSVFGNLEEVCKVSLDFCRALLNVVEVKTSHHFGCANSIETAFESFGSVLCPPYQRYCTSFTNSITYREELKQNEDFSVFLKWCERNPKCQRLKLNDFLVSPMQHLTKYPLLLRHIAEYTSDKSQNALIETTLLAVQDSLKALDGKVSWLTHFQFLQDLQSSISWPPVYELDTKTILPEPLRNALSIQPCRNLIANPKRQLILDGTLSIIENGRSIEIYALLFDDMMVFTRPRKGKRKASEIPSSLKRHPVLKDGTLLMVHRQPVALDRFMVYDVETEHASTLGVKNAFLVVQENRFQQMTTITMLQASSEDLKRKWLTRLASTAAQWMEKHIYASANISSPCINRKPGENGLTSQELVNIGTRSRLARQKSVGPSEPDLSNETFSMSSMSSESRSPWLELNGCFIDP